MEWGLEVVCQLLDAHQPMNLNQDAITVTAEGPAVGIVLLPHQDLGGRIRQPVPLAAWHRLAEPAWPVT
jgi:hypothetical protein